jgi:N-acetylmuramoyl-L-alanine amidase
LPIAAERVRGGASRGDPGMDIIDHRLVLANGPARFVATPNLGQGVLDPVYLLIHYTAGRGLDSSVAWLADPRARASAHLVVGRDGTVVQLAAFDRIAWHAGQSRWRDRVGLNSCAIGIELDNAGMLERRGAGFRAWFGGDYPAGDACAAAHRHDGVQRHWHNFTAAQIEVAAEIATVLVQRYGLKDVLGHDDVSPGRKWDPGPAFPMDSFRARVMGRDDDRPVELRTLAALNLRDGPGLAFGRLPESPLPPASRLRLMASQGQWCEVELLDPAGAPRATGWVHGAYVREVG